MAGSSCLIISALLLMCVVQLDAACTEETFALFEACTYTFYKDLDYIMASGSRTNLTEFCNTGSEKHTDCVNAVAIECRYAGGFYRQLWDNTINVDIVTNTLKVTCQENTTEVIVANHECIKNTQPIAGVCVVKEYQKYQGLLTWLETQIEDRGMDWYEEELYQAVCHYVESIRDCERPFLEDCGKDTGKLYEDRFYAGLPPVCSAKTSTVNALTVAFLSLLAGFK